ncbi:hypothetical protein GE061_002855 [Apolygus lucorum]|uniref:Uncharacterized protein n=1 Tax=Apolygus lucorum TaxID=248454 RepID=A0A8S9X6A5_APOLU|nr:hypothetical protein GE061_002855 [Apolygus lucorum]
MKTRKTPQNPYKTYSASLLSSNIAKPPGGKVLEITLITSTHPDSTSTWSPQKINGTTTPHLTFWLHSVEWNPLPQLVAVLQPQNPYAAFLRGRRKCRQGEEDIAVVSRVNSFGSGVRGEEGRPNRECTSSRDLPASPYTSLSACPWALT